MSKAIIISLIAAFALACGPQVDDEERPPGDHHLGVHDPLERQRINIGLERRGRIEPRIAGVVATAG